MTSMNRTSFTLGHQGWLLLPLCLALGASLHLQAMPQQTPGQATPPSSSALMRWWNGLGRHHMDVKTDDKGTLITESGWGIPERVYRITRDADGHVKETYAENGKAKPVDDAVHRWAEATLQASNRPIPVPPAPPAPPAPPTFGQSEAGQAVLRAIQNDSRLIAQLGAPLNLDAQIKGSITTWAPGEPHGLHLYSPTGGAKADVTVAIHGPKGSAMVRAVGERKGREWSFSRLEVQPENGGSRLNLLTR